MPVVHSSTEKLKQMFFMDDLGFAPAFGLNDFGPIVF